MKLLLIIALILVYLSVEGQPRSIRVYGYEVFKEPKIDIKDISPEIVDVAAIDLYYKYVEYCHNDSTPSIYKWVTGSNPDGTLITECRIEYIHQTPTFEGFIRYLHMIDPRKQLKTK
jgi:hypothetical protein